MGRVIFIASLSHSGSTVMDLILGSHSRFVGLGELSTVLNIEIIELDKLSNQVCTCGKSVDTCDYWGEITDWLRSNESLNLSEKYKYALNKFSSTFGNDFIPVDSSKNLASMRALLGIPKVNLEVLYLIKDVRSFVISQLDSDKRRKRRRRSVFRLFWYWYWDNKNIQSFLTRNDIRSFQLGYEELCLYPEAMIQKVCDFLGEIPESAMLSLRESKSHIIHGNRMRNQLEKNKQIQYDSRWFYRSEWMLAATLLPRIIRYNNNQVYANGLHNIWGK